VTSFFDTSVLVPVFLEDHEHHERSFKAFANAYRRHDYCAAHSLAEVYSTMTRLPGRHRLSGDQVLLFLDDIREHLTLIALTGDEYHATINEAAGAGVVGGTIYDASFYAVQHPRCLRSSNRPIDIVPRLAATCTRIPRAAEQGIQSSSFSRHLPLSA
jgi:predicted nucleic acid-binding protein